ncbi:hypothetical protein FSP39_019222 [Pinctada imbricata]|uniref:Protein-serine/threonine kinase n=1 Tax=Pinctada imbricata TaxID=66713 RepID=A0AA89C985_PINIB|nr:hypothetical protein FSP39_019222 [Pinctada imbricata]
MKLTVKTFQKLAFALDFKPNFVPVPLSLKSFTDFGQDKCESRSFKFLREEIPVRLSHIMREFHDLPDSFSSRKSVQLVRGWYERSYEELQRYEHQDTSDPKVLKQFLENIQAILNRHAKVVETMAQGVMEMQETFNIDPKSSTELQYFLDRFYMNRISVRMLLTQHVELFSRDRRRKGGDHIGIIDPSCDVGQIVDIAYNNAKQLCEQQYLISPNMDLILCNNSNENQSIQMVCVPTHLEYMVFELIKNAMRAVVEFHSKETEVPNIKVIISKGKEDITIKISDLGGGVPYSVTDILFQYHYTTAPRPQENGPSPALAGYGYGLPLSRLYARYFGGEISLSSVEGYGTDAFIYLKVNPEDANECLPVYNKTTSKMYDTNQVVPDWSSPRPWNQSYRTFCTGTRFYHTSSWTQRLNTCKHKQTFTDRLQRENSI